MKPITAAMLYDLVRCPHRVHLDLFADPKERDSESPFVQLLWEKGNLFEKETIRACKIPFLDLSAYAGDEKERMTREAMDRGEPLIYAGRISSDNLLGDPDLLRKEGTKYLPGDIKSGAGEEGGDEDGDDEGRPKRHYAVQLALYVDILERQGCSAGRKGFIWDVHGSEVAYDLETPPGPRSDPLWAVYQECLAEAQKIVAGSGHTLPAYASVCKECHWYSSCKRKLKELDDITLIPELGRSRRESLKGSFATVKELAAADPARFIQGKKTVFPGIGPGTLIKFHRSARLLSDPQAKPLMVIRVDLPATPMEIFFDVETDPMRDLCYLHGIVERSDGRERYLSYFAEEPSEKSEERAFADLWAYLKGSGDARVYVYSAYERTTLKKLAKRYPRVCSEAEVLALFKSRVVDLYYGVVKPATAWPTHDHSIKTLAKYLGFTWRDTHPSGAASIEWFHRWVESKDPTIRQRILDYNEDDCRATRVLLDGIRHLPQPG